MRELWARCAWAVEEWWCRHVSQRELYRHLDVLRDAIAGRCPDGLVTAQMVRDGFEARLRALSRPAPREQPREELPP